MPGIDHAWWRSISRDKDQASWLNDTIRRAGTSPSPHEHAPMRYPAIGRRGGGRFPGTKRRTEFDDIERRAARTPFHVRSRTQLHAERLGRRAKTRSGRVRETFSRARKKYDPSAPRPATDAGPTYVMDPDDIAFDETVGIVWSDSNYMRPFVLDRSDTPGPSQYPVVDERAVSSRSKSVTALSMARGKKPPTPLDWAIKRAKEKPSPQSYNPPPRPKVHGGKLQRRVPTYLDHAIRRSRSQPGPFSYAVHSVSTLNKRTTNLNTAELPNWCENLMKAGRKTPSVHSYENNPSSLSQRTTNMKSAALPTWIDEIHRRACQTPSSQSYDVKPAAQKNATSVHMAMAPRVTDVDLKSQRAAAIPGPGKSLGPCDHRGKRIAVNIQDYAPFSNVPRDLNDTLVERESKLPGPSSYETFNGGCGKVYQTCSKAMQKGGGGRRTHTGTWNKSRRVTHQEETEDLCRMRAAGIVIEDPAAEQERQKQAWRQRQKRKKRRQQQKALQHEARERKATVFKRGEKVAVTVQCRALGQKIGLTITMPCSAEEIQERARKRLQEKSKGGAESVQGQMLAAGRGLERPVRVTRNAVLQFLI